MCCFLSPAVQVKQTNSYHIAKKAALDQETRESFIVLLPEVQAPPGVSEVEMRSLGYLGSFLLQYTSAQVRYTACLLGA